MTIKQSVLNTFDRVGIDPTLDNEVKSQQATNWITGASCEVTELILACIEFVYETSSKYERGNQDIKLGDFDRVRYFIAEADPNAYSTCID